MFCGCPTEFGADPTRRFARSALAYPGSLPVVNRAAVESTITIGLALNCDIAPWSRFARKNYFYPDMPKDYQITQYDEPLCSDGYLDVDVVTRRGAHQLCGSRSSACTWRRTPANSSHRGRHRPYPRRRLLPGRLQPRRYAAHRDRHQTRTGTGALAPEVGRPTCRRFVRL